MGPIILNPSYQEIAAFLPKTIGDNHQHLGPDLLLLLPLLSVASGLLDSIATHYSYNNPDVIRTMGRRLCHS